MMHWICRRCRYLATMSILNNQSIKTLISFAVVIAIWQMAIIFNEGTIMPSGLEVLKEMSELLVDKHFLKDVGATLLRLVVGMSAGCIIGFVLGVLIGYYSFFTGYIYPLVKFIISIPKISLLPILIILLGIGELSKISLVALGAFYPTVITTIASVKRISMSQINSGLSLGFNRQQILRYIIIPAAFPNILNGGLRLSLSASLLLLVAAEMIAARFGLGFFINYTGSELELTKMMAGIGVLSSIGLIGNKIIDKIHSKKCAWAEETEGKLV